MIYKLNFSGAIQQLLSYSLLNFLDSLEEERIILNETIKQEFLCRDKYE